MSDDDNKTPSDKEKQFTLRANLSVNAEDEYVGAGLMAVHMDRGLLKLRQIEEKKERANKSFNSMIARIEARLAELDHEINYWEGVANDAQEKGDAFRDEAEKYKTQRDKYEEDSEEWNKWNKKVKEAEENAKEQDDIRDDALDNKRIAQAEKNALEKTYNQALSISNALDTIGAKKAGLDTTAASLVGKLNAVEQKMNGAGMDDVAVLALMNGTYEPITPEQVALIREYEEIKEEIKVLDVQIDALDKDQDVVTENIIEARKTIEGREATREAGSNVATIEATEEIRRQTGGTDQDVEDISSFTEAGDWGSFSVDKEVPPIDESAAVYDVVADGNITTPKIDLTKSYAFAASGVDGTIQEPEILAKQDGKQYEVSFAIT